MKNHLKRIASPRTWTIDRKGGIFTTRPKPGSHKLEDGLALGTVLRDFLGLAKTTSEVKKLLNNNQILVDGKARKDHKFIVGLFDVLTIESAKKSYRLYFDRKGRIIIKEISVEESSLKPCQVIGKTVLAGGKVQYHLHDGKNVLTDVKAKVGDTLLLSLPKLEVKEVLPLQKGATVYLTKGKHSGDVGQFKEIIKKEAIYLVDKTEIETAKAYLFVIGKDKAMITIDN
jgi:small subunit ribosomal protein S4e